MSLSSAFTYTAKMGKSIAAEQTLIRMGSPILGCLAFRGVSSGIQVTARGSLEEGESVPALPLPLLRNALLPHLESGTQFNLPSATAVLPPPGTLSWCSSSMGGNPLPSVLDICDTNTHTARTRRLMIEPLRNTKHCFLCAF